MVRFARAHGVESEPNWFPLPENRGPGQIDDGRPPRCVVDPRDSEPPAARPLSRAEERSANKRARSALDVMLPDLPSAGQRRSAGIPTISPQAFAILAHVCQGERSRHDLLQRDLAGIEPTNFCKLSRWLTRRGLVTKGLRIPPGGRRPECFLQATPRGLELARETAAFYSRMTALIAPAPDAGPAMSVSTPDSSKRPPSD
jgi:hypothetical protein